MKLVAFACPACGAQLSVDIEKKQASCQYCGATFPVDDEAQHIRYDNAEQAGYEFEKGRQRAQAEYAQRMAQQPYQIPVQQEAPKRKRRTWLWVLGWIFMFPIPLTILMMRNRRLNEKLRMGIIIAAWIIYLIWMMPSSKNGSDATTQDGGSQTETGQPADGAPDQTAEYVIEQLLTVDHVQDPTAVTEDHDPNKGLSKEKGYVAAVFFSSDLVEQEVKGDDVIDRGTDGGGCVEVFRNEADAKARDEYLGSAGDFLSLAGSHVARGNYVIRTSRYLSKSQQKELETAIIEALTASE